MEHLNTEQQLAVNADAGAYCLLSTAGSGKTRVITDRVKRLLNEGNSVNDILVLTFTSSAAKELEKRIGVPVSKETRAGFRTFHSLGLRLIQDERRHLPFGLSETPIPEGPVLSKLLSDTMKEFGVSKKQFKEVRSFISKAKRTHTAPADALAAVDFLGDDSFAKVYDKYQSRLRDGGMLDFDDLIVYAVDLLEKPDVRERWQFKFLMADEAQDTDDQQFRMMQLMSERYGNVFLVGDACQALYSFRGANPDNLLEVKKWWSGAKTMYLPQNYRSSGAILQFCKENAPIQDELMSTMRTDNEYGSPVEFRMFRSDEEEAESTVAAALIDPGNSAILARTNAQLADFETVCTLNNVRFHLLGKAGFWHQSEIKMVVRLAGFALSVAPAKTYSQEAVANLRNKLRTMPAQAAVKTILEASGIESMYASNDYAEEDNFALKNLKKLVQIAGRFSSLSEFVRHARKAEHASRKAKNAITLSTVHQAKGLEWSNVFVCGVQEGKLPHEKGEFSEEQRIWYVAISRAAKRLRVSFSGVPSVFLKKYLTPEMKAEAGEKIQSQMGLFA